MADKIFGIFLIIVSCVGMGLTLEGLIESYEKGIFKKVFSWDIRLACAIILLLLFVGIKLVLGF